MLIALYAVAAVLELGGIALVVFDVWTANERARTLGEHLKLRPHVSRHTPSDKAPLQLQRSIQRAEHDLGDAIIALTGGRLRRRLVGPGLLAAGVIVGTVANIAAH